MVKKHVPFYWCVRELCIPRIDMNLQRIEPFAHTATLIIAICWNDQALTNACVPFPLR